VVGADEFMKAGRLAIERKPTNRPSPGVPSPCAMKKLTRNAPAAAAPWLRTVLVMTSGRFV